jgi:hypothetical protein
MTQIIGYRSDNLEIVKLYVKKAFTTVTKTYSINVNAPLREIMEFILNNAINDFQMDSNDPKELVEAGQYIPDVKSEDAPALELDYPDETFKQRFRNSYKNTAFYIRKAL